MKARASFIKKLSGSLRASPHNLPVTAQGRRGNLFSVGRIPSPSNPQTTAQQDHRRFYRNCFRGYQGLTNDEKEAWGNYASELNVTNYNAMMRSCMLGTLSRRYWWRWTAAYSSRACYGAKWVGLTWQVGAVGPNEDHISDRWNQFFCKSGSPPSLVYSIRATSDLITPAGPDLAIGQIDCDDFAACPGMENVVLWHSAVLLRKNTRYALLMRVPSGDVSNQITWYYGGISPGMASDRVIYSNDGGATWNEVMLAWNTGSEWGTPLPSPP